MNNKKRLYSKVKLEISRPKAMYCFVLSYIFILNVHEYNVVKCQTDLLYSCHNFCLKVYSSLEKFEK